MEPMLDVPPDAIANESDSEVPDKIKQWMKKMSSAERKRLDEACAKYPSPLKSTLLYYDYEFAIADMRRDSKYKRKAMKRGLIRPFLLLVSMYPNRRAFLAHTLGINLLEDNFGDPHKEAFEIIGKSRKSIQGRTNEPNQTLNPFSENSSWYQAAYRAAKIITNNYDKMDAHDIRMEVQIKKKRFDDAIELSKTTDKEKLSQMILVEELLLKSLFQLVNITADNLLTTHRVRFLHGSDRYRLVLSRLKEHGWQSNDFCDLIALIVSSQEGIENAQKDYQKYAIPFQEKKGSTSLTKMEVDGVKVPIMTAPLGIFFTGYLLATVGTMTKGLLSAALGKSSGKLIRVIIAICFQRLFLNIADIRIEDFYTSKEEEEEDSEIVTDNDFHTY